MKNNRTTLEVITQSVEEAVEKGLADLGLDRDQVEVTVLDEGGFGILGLGSRQARVRISVLGEEEEDSLPSQEPAVSDEDKDQTLLLAEEIVSDLLEKIKTSNPQLPVIMMTAHGTVDKAVEAMEKGGEVNVTTRNQVVDDKMFAETGINSGEYAVLSVSDTGYGIPESDREHIFEPFYRVDKSRTKDTWGTGWA